MTETLDAAPAPTPARARVRASLPLRDLQVARENLRHGEPADDGVPQLAATILAAGLMQPLTVRPGRGKRERPGMVLDGRRRLLALELLLARGDVADDYPVEVFVETDPARQAAAAVLTNTAVPVHVADVILAVGRMLKGRLTPQAIAAALGYAEIEIKRLAALAQLPPPAIEALRLGRITLRQARLLARLADRDAQVEIAELALAGSGFQEWRVNERLAASQVTARDPRCALVGPDLYREAGGRAESDLFGELPDRLLDPAILTRAWEARAGEIGQRLEAEGLAVRIDVEDGPPPDETLEPFGYVASWGLPDGAQDAWRTARDRHGEAADELRGSDLTGDEAVERIVDFCRSRVAMDQAGAPDRIVTAAVLSPDVGTGVSIRCWGPPADPPVADDEAEEDGGEPPAPPWAPPRAAFRAPDTEEVSHVLHRTRTEVATSGLVRAVADAPKAALIGLVARLLEVSVSPTADGASTARAALGDVGRSIEALDGVVRERLGAARAAWAGSGLTAIGWVAALPEADRGQLLADLFALSLDLREARTSATRAAARAQATELATLAEADLARVWTPDAEFLAVHGKAQLTRMLEEMGEASGEAATMGKSALVERVRAAAERRGWAPAALRFDPPEPEEEEAGAEAEAA